LLSHVDIPYEGDESNAEVPNIQQARIVLPVAAIESKRTLLQDRQDLLLLQRCIAPVQVWRRRDGRLGGALVIVRHIWSNRISGSVETFFVTAGFLLAG
jgi:hypothetical protein